VLAAVSVAAIGYRMLWWLGIRLSLSEAISPPLAAWMPQLALVLTTILVALPKGRLPSTLLRPGKAAPTSH
jgi:hypothetical protein